MGMKESEQRDVAAIPKKVYPPVSVSALKKATEAIRQKSKESMIKTLAQYEDSIEFVPTGFSEVDTMLGGGIPKGKIIEIYGKEGSGKSSLGYYLASRYQAAVYIDAEAKFTKERALFWGIDPQRCIINVPKTAEIAIDSIIEYSDCSGLLIIVDSVPALTPKKQEDALEKESVEKQAGVALRARLLNDHIWTIARQCQLSGATVIFINQLREKIGAFMMFGDNTYTPGGMGLKYAESMKWLVVAKEKLKKSGEIYGVRVGMAMKKNQVSQPFMTCELNLIFDQGFRTRETEKEDLDAARKRHLKREKEMLAQFGKILSEEEVTQLERMNAWEQDDEEEAVEV